MMKKALAVGLAAVMALTTIVSEPREAQARGGGVAIGIAAAVIGGALLYSALRHRHRYAYYPRRHYYAASYYYGPRVYYAPRRHYYWRRW
jgi:hypothetical protein